MPDFLPVLEEIPLRWRDMAMILSLEKVGTGARGAEWAAEVP